MLDITGGAGPHRGQPVVTAGAPVRGAGGALILVHGRGGSAADILSIAGLVAGPTVACLAPQAAENTWYPVRFTEPVARNEPWLSSGLAVLHGLVEGLIAAGIPAERIALLGFSQGACLSVEFAFRRRARLGAVLCLSGGLIGEAVAMPEPGGHVLGGMKVLLGCGDRDAHIPLRRVKETDLAMRALGADLTTRIYPNGGHSINDDEVQISRAILAAMIGP